MRKDPSVIRHVLLSYPRCGRSWLCYIVRLLTDKVTDGLDAPRDDAILSVTHNDNQISHIHNSIPLVLLLRNYKECIQRHCQQRPDGECQHGNYWRNVIAFDGYEGPKLVLYYEDLICEPRKTVELLASFMSIAKEKVDDFYHDYETHRLKSMAGYHPGCQTSGTADGLLWHSRSMTPEDGIAWDKMLMERDVDIFDRYLRRYKVKI